METRAKEEKFQFLKKDFDMVRDDYIFIAEWHMYHLV